VRNRRILPEIHASSARLVECSFASLFKQCHFNCKIMLAASIGQHCVKSHLLARAWKRLAGQSDDGMDQVLQRGISEARLHHNFLTRNEVPNDR
jgi:hypothetical protein